ncbi:hypothetical protein BLNAU_11663 [Blattamonas nauphoetae]|uniref:Uncharacterized protein n=1 Tax=Blattamonas nauphoetae TaxID=2049346 RepID=A0ABQ9XLT7_9EUKA|nr:hypothetical protein BLNAU_11663 [Blattamonas nauphoetae]
MAKQQSSLNPPFQSHSPPFAVLPSDEASVKEEKANQEDEWKRTGDGVSWVGLPSTNLLWTKVDWGVEGEDGVTRHCAHFGSVIAEMSCNKEGVWDLMVVPGFSSDSTSKFDKATAQFALAIERKTLTRSSS